MAKKRTRAGNSRDAAAARRALFVEKYCENGCNGRQAYKVAGYSTKQSNRTIDVEVCRLLRRPDVKKAVEARRAQTFAVAQQNTQLTANEVLEDLAQAKRFDPAKMYGANGQLLPVKDMPVEVRLHLESVEVDEIAVGTGENRTIVGHTSKVRYPKKTAIREQAMRHFGLYEMDNRQKPATTVNVGLLTVGLDFDKVRARSRKLAAA